MMPITQLSDSLMALSVMLQDIERRQGLGLAADIAHNVIGK